MTKTLNALANRKKVRTRQILNQSNLYYLNNRRLSFLPKIFLGFSIVLIICGLLWYLNVFDLQTVVGKPVSQQSEQLTALDLIRQLNWNTTSQSNTTDEQTANQQGLNSDKLVLLTAQNGATCALSLQPNPPENIKPIAQSQPQGWWLPSHCPVSELVAVQIVRLNSTEANKLAQAANLIQVQNLDGLDTYAIIYFNQPSKTSFDQKNISNH